MPLFVMVKEACSGPLESVSQGYQSKDVSFHVVSYILSKLTQHPESVAAQELRSLVLQISGLKTKDQLKLWLSHYKHWYQIHYSFLKEKTFQYDNLTLTGRPKWHYTHGRLHAAHSHLKNAIPNLFKYFLHPQIPNTSNFVEGAINSPLQEKLRSHRGLKLPKRRILIAYFLSSKQP